VVELLRESRDTILANPVVPQVTTGSQLHSTYTKPVLSLELWLTVLAWPTIPGKAQRKPTKEIEQTGSGENRGR